MQLKKLIFADILRDGGSYVAAFETNEDRNYGVRLQRSRMPDAEGLHHRWLFESFGEQRPDGDLPIVTGSNAERALIARLKGFLALAESGAPDMPAPVSADSLRRLGELIKYIERREPCLSSDVEGWRKLGLAR